MAILPTPESSGGIMGAIKGALGLFGETNKAQGVNEVSQAQPVDEYESSFSEKEILELVSIWKRDYNVYYDPIDQSQKLAFNYWIGQHRGEQTTNSNLTTASNDVVDNLIFEAVETFLPIATRANPDPLVSADPSEIGQKLSHDIKAALVNWADKEKLRRKLAKQTRHWVIYRLGAIKMYWDVITKEIKIEVVNPRRMIFDKDGYIDEGGRFIGEYMGEKKKIVASKLMVMFPNKKEVILKSAGGKEGTKLEYYEWWYRGKDIFYTLDDHVLGKFKNPNWNYDIEPQTNPETGEVMGEGQEGVNHFSEPFYPYVFLSLFSTGLHPHDDTSLIMQNISVQDLVNRRYRQIDKNVQGMNEGLVVSGTSFTEEQASQAAAALRRGTAIRVPNGDVGKAVLRLPTPPLPRDVAENLQDARAELRNIFGTSGSTPQALEKQDTVRGKILVNQQDSSRIGGGITEQIEQVADTIYNMVVQFMFVYYDEEHFVVAAGEQGGLDLIAIKNTAFPLLKSLNITVKEGSLVPKDPLTQRNEAIDLWSAGAIDPLNFFKKLDFPDPVQATNQLILWQMFQKGQVPPNAYLPSFAVAGQPAQQQMQPPPTVGGPAVSPPPNSTPPEGNPQPQPESPEAVQAESQQLIRSVPAQ